MKWGWLKTVGKIAIHVVSAARAKGVLTDELLGSTREIVEVAEKTFKTNEERREWAVAALRTAGIHEAEARLAVELAVSALKHQTDVPYHPLVQ